MRDESYAIVIPRTEVEVVTIRVNRIRLCRVFFARYEKGVIDRHEETYQAPTEVKRRDSSRGTGFRLRRGKTFWLDGLALEQWRLFSRHDETEECALIEKTWALKLFFNLSFL